MVDGANPTLHSTAGSEDTTNASSTAPPATGPSPRESTSASTSTSTMESTVSAVEIAISELQQTIDDANAYRMAPLQRPQILRSHMRALQEDTDMLIAIDTPDDILRARAARLIFLARRTSRSMEREAIDLEIQQSEDQPRLQDVAGDQVRQCGFKLAPLQLPQFDGQPSQFLIFRNFFEENVLHDSTLTDTSKWLRLKECLKGHPAELIADLPQTSSSLDVAWKLLLQIYGGDDKPIIDLYNKLQSMSPAAPSTVSLRLTHSRLEGILMSLEHLGHDIEENRYLRYIVIGKFPPEILYHVPQKKESTLRELRNAISEVIATRELADYQRVDATPSTSNIRSPNSITSATRAPASTPNRSNQPKKSPAQFPRTPKCVFCAAEHWNDTCQIYRTISARKQQIMGKCFKCLRPTHEPNPCINEKRCFHCDSLQHNRALCPVKFRDNEAEQPTVPTLAVVPAEPCVQHPQTTGFFLTFLARATAQTVEQPVRLRVVLDTAGGSTLIREEAARQLHLCIAESSGTSFTGLGDQHLLQGRALHTDVQLIAENGDHIAIRPTVVRSIIQEVPVMDVSQFRRDHAEFDHLHIPPTGKGQPVDLLLGSDALVDVLSSEKLITVNANMLLMPTKFGWLILGRSREHQLKVCHTTILNLLSNPLKLMSDLDLVGLTELHNSDIDEEQQAIKKFYETVTFTSNRYSISWPWRTYPPNLDSNYGLALGRLRSLYKRLQQTPHLLHEYHQIIVKQLAEGIIEKVEPNSPVSPHTHYVPHHPVLQPGKSTTVRPVYDGAAKASPKKLSLNDNILKGTKWLNDLVETLIRFRRHKNVVTADIAKAFHQIAINDADRDAVRFLWLKNPDLPPTEDNLQVYRFTRVAFGIIASPFILHATINYHATRQPPNEFIDIILNDLYADNLVTALDDSIDPTDFYRYAKQFFGTMSMNLTKWSSNNEELKSYIPEDDRILDTIQSVLGIAWNMQTDTLSLRIPRNLVPQSPTRRMVAHEMASFFDPLGWAAPVILIAKLFFRRIWEQTEKWDTLLTEKDTEEWHSILTNLRDLAQIQLPRQMFTIHDISETEIHTFVDASQQAYAAVSYIRVQNKETSQIAIVASKCRLAPKKQLTIPKLELTAMILGCRLTKFIKEALQLDKQIKTFVWSDSRCVIAWMKQNRLLPPIIDKYVRQAASYEIDNILYVPSTMNYADVATRGGTVDDLRSMQWWTGPRWLPIKECWPEQKPENSQNTKVSLFFEDKLTLRNPIVDESEIQGVATLDIANFATLTDLLRRTAYCFKALIKFSKRNFLQTDSDVDLNAARRWWIYWDQSRHYALQNEPLAGQPFKLNGIQVFRDTFNIIRCHTRLLNSTTELETVTPILLVKKSTLTKLLIIHTHVLHNHAGTNHTLANLRREFWLPQGRREIYNTIRIHCFHCRRYQAKPYPTPPPPPLPDFRTTTTNQPFQVIGIDIFGPFYVRSTVGRNQEKAKVYGLIFTCSLIRAVHIEMLREMTTTEVSYAFRKFVARRGVPIRIVSDNAPQFHELDGRFQNLWKTLAQSATISAYFAQRRITWQFITETAPWMGGFYERLIQIIKKSLEKTYGDKILLERQFETTLIEIEAIVNSRPISYVDRELNSPIVTPNDFLMAKFVAVPIETASHHSDHHINKLWKSSQQYLQQFWENWAHHYLLMLRDRHDHLQSNKSTSKSVPEKGDVVVMMDVSKKRSAWQLAVVERRIISKDNQIRSVQIRIPNGSRLLRPVVSLAPLNLLMDLPKISDGQLNKARNAITLVPPEGASQEYLKADENEMVEVEPRGEGRSYREREAMGEGGGAVPYRSNGSENELGSATAELSCGGPSSEAASLLAGSVVDDHD